LYLDLNLNYIRNLKNGTFNGMNSLQILSIERNDSESLDSKAFEGLYQLKNLNLTNNLFEFLSPELINFNLKNSSRLGLSQNK
jgi:hypothetical protein